MRRTLLIFIFISLLFPISLFCGITGKITGAITDKESGEALIGVNVVLKGTGLGAATDINGYYSILNVPPGTYNLKATMIGYQSVIQQNVRVMVDLTSIVNFTLSSKILKGEEIIVLAEAPTVQRDVTSTSFRIGSDQIGQLQVVDLNEVIELQAGVVNGHFRGGRLGEVMYIVDGIPMNDAYSGEVPFAIENEIVQEVEVISGTFNAEYGQAMSGIVNIVTKEGQEYYSGKVLFFAGDYFSSHDDLYLNMKDINPLAISNSQFSLSGPIPIFSNRTSFSILGRLYNSDGWIYGQRLFIPSDSCYFSEEGNIIQSSGDGKFVSMNPELKKSLQGKVTFKIFKNDKINVSSFYQLKQYKEFDRLFKYNPEGNYDALSMANLCKKLLEHIGINPKRLRIEWVSAGEGIRFANIMNEFSKEIEELGPLGKSEGIDEIELKSRLEKITKLIPYIKLAKREKLALHDINQANEENYAGLYTSEEIDALICEAPAYYIDPEKCQACMICARRCPVEAIISAKNQIHVIDQEKCIKCGTCLEACPPKFGAVTRFSGEPVPPPLPEEERTIVRKSKREE